MDYNYKIIKFLLYRADNERKKLLETIRLIIKDGIGSCHLDKITRKSFLDTGDDYYTRLCYYVEKEPENIKFLFDALIEWYEFWKEEFCDFFGNESEKYAKFRLKTWTYCILNGIPEVYEKLSNEVSVTLTEEELSYLKVIHAVQQKVYEDRHFIDKEKIDAEGIAQMERKALSLIKQTIKEADNQKIKSILSGKKLIFYTNGRWAYDKLQEIQFKYDLESISQESALEIPKSYKQCDYLIYSSILYPINCSINSFVASSGFCELTRKILCFPYCFTNF